MRFEFRALERIFFPAGKAGNVFRGALGSLMPQYEVRARLPVGFKETPRPFALRVSHLDGLTFEAGESFEVGVNIFDYRSDFPGILRAAMAKLEQVGIGPRRGRVELVGEPAMSEVAMDLAAAELSERVAVRFVTPTELKGMSGDEVSFRVLFARVRDRLSLLASLYGDAGLAMDFAGMGARAAAVNTVSCAVKYREVVRQSSRTGQSHGIGGFVGTAKYEGALGEFVPYLRAASWTGVGRHTVWGNGVIQIE